MNKTISIIDTGASNLHSVYKAFKFIGVDVEITKDPLVIEKSNAVVFPGVGAFGAVMNAVYKNNLQDAIIKSAKSEKPFLGICVGLQALFEDSEETEGVKGLGILKGKVVKFKKAKTVPHIGWNGKFYFVHSYYVIPEDKSIITSETEYEGEKFVSSIKKNNLIAVQFHPEKSGEVGLEFLRGFVGL